MAFARKGITSPSLRILICNTSSSRGVRSISGSWKSASLLSCSFVKRWKHWPGCTLGGWEGGRVGEEGGREGKEEGKRERRKDRGKGGGKRGQEGGETNSISISKSFIPKQSVIDTT